MVREAKKESQGEKSKEKNVRLMYRIGKNHEGVKRIGQRGKGEGKVERKTHREEVEKDEGDGEVVIKSVIFVTGPQRQQMSTLLFRGPDCGTPLSLHQCHIRAVDED